MVVDGRLVIGPDDVSALEIRFPLPGGVGILVAHREPQHRSRSTKVDVRLVDAALHLMRQRAGGIVDGAAAAIRSAAAAALAGKVRDAPASDPLLISGGQAQVAWPAHLLI